LLAPTKAEGAAGWPTSRNSRWVGRPITLASLPLTTNSTCLATASPRAGPGFDVVLRPTKGVSILYGLGDPATGRAVLAAHHAGVAEAVAYLDTHIGTRRHGGHEHVSGQGLLAVGFDHRTSRGGDPLLHTHLVANRVQEPDGRWTALDGRDLYRHRLAADAIYWASYQRQLSRTLGVEWTAADAYGNRELEGLPEDLVRLHSKRTDRIDLEVERLEASGGSGPRGWSSGPSMPPRKPKAHKAADTLYGRWRTEAEGDQRDCGRPPGREALAGQRQGRRVPPLCLCPDQGAGQPDGGAARRDLAVPGSQANLDHMVIGSGGVFVIDSKQYRGLRLDPTGRLWHGRYPSPLRCRRCRSRLIKPPWS
jgi:conjugative relaxase-like TrwC/TraI family protein